MAACHTPAYSNCSPRRGRGRSSDDSRGASLPFARPIRHARKRSRNCPATPGRGNVGSEQEPGRPIMPEIAGGCLCGKVRYSATGEPAFVGVCHCTDCQKFTGSAFAIVIGVPKPALKVEGTLATYSK